MKIVKDKTKLAVKLFIAVWIVLAVQVVLKLTFNYWQPYVIPTPQLQAISDFVDNNVWIEDITDFIMYFFNCTIMILCSIKSWWFKNKKMLLFTYIILLVLSSMNYLKFLDVITPIIAGIIVPLILDYKKWIWTFLTFGLNFVFLFLSTWLSSVSNTSELPYIIKIFFNFDYYIMLIIYYFIINLIKNIKLKNIFKRKGVLNNG